MIVLTPGDQNHSSDSSYKLSDSIIGGFSPLLSAIIMVTAPATAGEHWTLLNGTAEMSPVRPGPV